MPTTRWKDKSEITLAADDRLPITDVSASNTDGYSSPEALRRYVVQNTHALGIRRPAFVNANVKGLLCDAPGALPAGSTMTSGVLRMSRFIAGESVTIAELGYYLQTAGAASTKVRLGIYSDRSDRSGPNALLVDSGEIATDGAAGYTSAAISQALVAGTAYWSASLFSGTPIVSGNTMSVSTTAPLGYVPSTHANTGFWAIWRFLSYAALPADESAQSYNMTGVAGCFVFYDI